MPLKSPTFPLCLAALSLLAGCSASRVPIVPGITPYRIDIQQGNIVTQEMLDKLEPGMSRNQVRFILGTPLIVDPFRTDRWDYVYRMNKRGDLVEQRQLKVFFKDDRMVRYEGDVVADAKPIEKPAVTAAAKPAAKPAVKPAAAKPDPTADLAKPIAKPQPKPVEPVAQPEPPKPAPPLAEVPRDTAQPQLRLAPSQGEPATPAEKAAAAAVPPPKPPESLEAVPLPRIEVPPEPAVAGSPPPVKPASAAAAVKPGVARRDDTQPGSAPAPFETPRATPAPVVAEKPAIATPPPPPPKPVDAPAPKVAEKPATKPIEKPVVKPAAKPEPAVASKPAEKPAEKPSGGFFGRLMDGLRSPPTGSFGGEREARPGEPPAPFVDPPKP